MIARFLLLLLFFWKSIPNDVRCAPSLSSSESRLKTYFFRSVYKDKTLSFTTVHMNMVRPCHRFVDGLSQKCINVYIEKEKSQINQS